MTALLAFSAGFLIGPIVFVVLIGWLAQSARPARERDVAQAWEEGLEMQEDVQTTGLAALAEHDRKPRP